MKKTCNLRIFQKTAQDFARRLTPLSDRAAVVGLSGELGSGKTTFVQAAARSLGVREKITSPTFVIIKTYNLPACRPGRQLTTYNKLIHIDGYRLKSGEELEKLGWREIISDPKNLVFIEWPENVASALPKNAPIIDFEFVDEATRKIRFPDRLKIWPPAP